MQAPSPRTWGELGHGGRGCRTHAPSTQAARGMQRNLSCTIFALNHCIIAPCFSPKATYSCRRGTSSRRADWSCMATKAGGRRRTRWVGVEYFLSALELEKFRLVDESERACALFHCAKFALADSQDTFAGWTNAAVVEFVMRFLFRRQAIRRRAAPVQAQGTAGGHHQGSQASLLLSEARWKSAASKRHWRASGIAKRLGRSRIKLLLTLQECTDRSGFRCKRTEAS